MENPCYSQGILDMVFLSRLNMIRAIEARDLYRAWRCRDKAALRQAGVLRTVKEARLLPHEEAVALLAEALLRFPNSAGLHCALGAAHRAVGRREEAEAGYRRALACSKEEAVAHCNLGNLFLERELTAEAEACYERAADCEQEQALCELQAGQVHLLFGKAEIAHRHFLKAMRVAPSLATIRLNLASLRHRQGREAEAMRLCCNSLKLNGRSAWACFQLAGLQGGRGLKQAAATNLKRAIALRPHFPEALFNLALLLKEEGKVEEAILLFERVLQLQPDCLEALWHLHLTLPVLYESLEDIARWRSRFEAGLSQLIAAVDLEDERQRRQAMLAAGCMTNFYLHYQGQNDLDLQKQYAEFVQRIVSANYPQWSQPLPVRTRAAGEKIRVGYISSHLYEHSVDKLFAGWLKHADCSRFECYAYHLGLPWDEWTERFRNYSAHFRHIPFQQEVGAGFRTTFEQACTAITNDQLDILVYLDIGMNPVTTLLAGLRLAPVQCLTWGHPVTSGAPNIDYFLSSEWMEPPAAQAHYSERLLLLPGLGVAYERPPVVQPRLKRHDFGLREEATVYLSCQSLFKYLPQYDRLFAEIAHRVPNAQFAFLAGGSPGVAMFRHRLSEAFNRVGLDSERFCCLLPRLSQADYWDLNILSDVYLDTCDWSGGVTTFQAVACGLPVVTLPGQFMRGRHSMAILRGLKIKETTCRSEDEYIDIAARLGLDRTWRIALLENSQIRLKNLYTDIACVRALEHFYDSRLLIPSAALSELLPQA